jgi:hypothetical protein
MTNAALILVLARALRAAADELERAGTSDSTPTRSRIPERPAREVDELAQRRADDALRRHGILRK